MHRKRFSKVTQIGEFQLKKKNKNIVYREGGHFGSFVKEL